MNRKNLVPVLILLVAGCTSGPPDRESELAVPESGSNLPESFDQTLEDMAALRESGFGWLVRDPATGSRQVTLNDLLQRAAELEADGRSRQARSLRQRIIRYTRLATAQVEAGNLAKPAYPEP